MRLLRWISGTGLRVTLSIAFFFAGYHLVNELRVLAGAPLNFLQRLELTALDVKFAFRGASKTVAPGTSKRRLVAQWCSTLTTRSGRMA